MTTPTTKTEAKKYSPVQQYKLEPVVFDAYDKEQSIKQALGSNRLRQIFEVAELRSVNFIEGVQGWRLTPRGLEGSFDIADGSIATAMLADGSVTFVKMQSIATNRLLGRSTAGSGSIEQLTIGTGLLLSAGALSTTITQYTDELAEDAVGGILADTSTIDFTYDDAGNSISAVLVSQYRRKSLFDHYADQGNGTTVETDLYSDTLAAGQLAANGEKLEAEYGGVFVSSATATRQIKIYFGGTVIFDSGALTLSLSAAWDIYASIIRVSATVIRYMISMTTEGAALAAYTATGELTGLTLANTNVLKITGQAAGVGAATNDIVAKLSSVEWKAAA